MQFGDSDYQIQVLSFGRGQSYVGKNDVLVVEDCDLPYTGEYQLPDLRPETQDRVWLKNYTKPMGSDPPDPMTLAYALTQLKDKFSLHMRDFKYELWDHQTVLDNFDPDSWKGSPGYPWNRYWQRKCDIPDPTLLALVAAFEEALFLGKRPVIAMLFAKLELVKKSKVLSDDQRFICGVSIELLYLAKKYLGCLVDRMYIRSRHLPFQLSLNTRSLQWTKVRYILTRNGEIENFLVTDVAGMEKSYNGVYLQAIRKLWLPYVPAQYRQLATAILECMDDYLVKGPNGIVTFMYNFNASGHPFTTLFNNVVMYLMTVVAIVMVIGRYVEDIDDLVSQIIYGDDSVLGITQELIDLGFTPVKFKQAMKLLGITIKCPDHFQTIDQCDFLSMRWVQFKNTMFYGPAPTRKDKIKLSLLVHHQKMTIPQYYMKIVQIRELVAFDDELWGYTEAVENIIRQRYGKMYAEDPEWQSAEDMLFPREIVQCRALGMLIHSRSDTGSLKTYASQEAEQN